jgi:hypothetical protein
MLFILQLFNILSLLFHNNNKQLLLFPSPGNTYYKKINLPLFGYQSIETKIITNNSGFIQLNGLINEKGTVKLINTNDYYMIKFSYNLRKIIKKYKTEFTFPYYDINNDKIFFNLNVKVINYNKKIKLDRIN